MSIDEIEIVNRLTERRELLGMSDYDIAARSGVSQPTVYRILSGGAGKASFGNLCRIAAALGFRIEAVPEKSAGDMREGQAAAKAGKIVAMTQATSLMEGQGVDTLSLGDMEDRLKQKLLAGPSKNLWSD
jgi:transcriptional regulator with XRE-family HTH domain